MAAIPPINNNGASTAASAVAPVVESFASRLNALVRTCTSPHEIAAALLTELDRTGPSQTTLVELITALSQAHTLAISGVAQGGRLDLLLATGVSTPDVARVLAEDLRDCIRARVPSMTQADRVALLSHILSRATINEVLTPLFVDVVTSIISSAGPTSAAVAALSPLASHTALRAVPPDCVFSLLPSVRHVLWAAAPARMEADVMYMLTHTMAADTSSHMRAHEFSVPSKSVHVRARDRAPTAYELLNSVRGDAALYHRVCSLLHTLFRKSRDVRWASIRFDLAILYAEAHTHTHTASASSPALSSSGAASGLSAGSNSIDPLFPVILEMERACVAGKGPAVSAATDAIARHVRRMVIAADAPVPAPAPSSAGGRGRGRAIVSAEGLPLTVVKNLIKSVTQSVMDFAHGRGGLAAVFLRPVDSSYASDFVASYSKAIAPNKPIDLSTIRKRAATAQYATIEEVTKDVRMMVENSRKFNGNNEYTTEAETILSFFEAQLHAAVQAAQRTSSHAHLSHIAHDAGEDSEPSHRMAGVLDVAEAAFVLCDPYFTRIVLTELLLMVPNAAKAGAPVWDWERGRARSLLAAALLGDCALLDCVGVTGEAAAKKALHSLVLSIVGRPEAASTRTLMHSHSEPAMSSLGSSAHGAHHDTGASPVMEPPLQCAVLVRAMQCDWLERTAVGDDAGAAGDELTTGALATADGPESLSMLKRGRHAFSRTTSLLSLYYVLATLRSVLQKTPSSTASWNHAHKWLSLAVAADSTVDVGFLSNLVTLITHFFQRLPKADAFGARLCEWAMTVLILPTVAACHMHRALFVSAHEQAARFLRQACDASLITPAAAAEFAALCIRALVPATVPSTFDSAAFRKDALAPPFDALYDSGFTSALAYVWSRPDLAGVRHAYAMLVEKHLKAVWDWEGLGLSGSVAASAAGVMLAPSGMLAVASPSPNTPFSTAGAWGASTTGAPSASPYFVDGTPMTPGSSPDGSGSSAAIGSAPRASGEVFMLQASGHPLPPTLARLAGTAAFQIGSPGLSPSDL